MNWTNALAVFGAGTGAGGLGWQMGSHRLTGGRVQVWPTRLKQEGRWWVRTSVSNVSRLDVTISCRSFTALGSTELGSKDSARIPPGLLVPDDALHAHGRASA